MIVIGLSAKMGCGKTTLADMIIGLLPEGRAVRLAFGDLLKRECSEHYGFPLKWCYSQEGKEKKFVVRTDPEGRSTTVREALQFYGTDYRRKQDPDYWTKAMESALLKISRARPNAVVVVDDVRFPNEAQVCLDNGFCFRIEPFPGWEPGPHAGHASETALDGWDKFTEVFHPGFGLPDLELVAQEIAARAQG